MAKVLLIGTGVLGKRFYRYLQDQGDDVVTVSRHSVDWSAQHIVAELSKLQPDQDFTTVYIIVTCKERSAAAYHEVFVLGIGYLLKHLPNNCQVVFISSTSVYAGLAQDTVINELHSAQPITVTAQQLMLAEQQIATSGRNYTVVRAAGLYSELRSGFFKVLEQRISSGELIDKKLQMIHEQDLCQIIYGAAKARLPLIIAADGVAYSARDWQCRRQSQVLGRGRFQSRYQLNGFYQLSYASISAWDEGQRESEHLSGQG